MNNTLRAVCHFMFLFLLLDISLELLQMMAEHLPEVSVVNIEHARIGEVEHISDFCRVSNIIYITILGLVPLCMLLAPTHPCQLVTTLLPILVPTLWNICKIGCPLISFTDWCFTFVLFVDWFFR